MRGHRLAGLLFALGLVVQGTAARAQEGEMEAASGAPSPGLVARALAIDPDRPPQLTDEQIVLARSIGRDVVCLCGTCPKEPISDCTCGWAGLNKRTIQAAVARGMTREKIVGTFRDVYGDKVLAMLPDEGFARTAWILPYTAALLGIIAVFLVGARYARSRRGEAASAGPTGDAPAPSPSGEESRKALARELEELD